MNRLRSRVVVAVFAAALLALTIALHAQFQGQRGIDRNSQPGFPGANPPAAPAASTDPPPLETDLVLLTVSVTAGDRALPVLTRDNFEVLEDGVPQKIAYYWQDSRPISVGLLIDDSDFMGVNHKYEDLRDVVPTFLKGKNAADEYFVVQFSTFPRMTVSYTTDAKQAPTLFPLGKEDATPDTALTDAIYLGLEAIKESANPRKALLVITAGGDKGCDDASTAQNVYGRPIPSDQLLAFAMKQPVQIYSMLIADDWGTANAGNACNQIPKDENTLDELAGATGGHAYLASNSQGGVNSIATEVARALKTQFLVGYKSTNTAKDGHRRGVKVKVNPPDGSPKLKVWTKSAYYAPKAKS